jgi:hypothetical protein
VARAAPDGYTLLFTTSGTHTSILFIRRVVPYDPIKDFTPITAAVTQAGILLANASLEVTSFKELLGCRNNPASCPTALQASVRRSTWPKSSARRRHGGSIAVQGRAPVARPWHRTVRGGGDRERRGDCRTRG